MNTDQQQSTCGLAMHHVPPGANYFISNCYVQDPVTGQLMYVFHFYMYIFVTLLVLQTLPGSVFAAFPMLLMYSDRTLNFQL